MGVAGTKKGSNSRDPKGQSILEYNSQWGGKGSEQFESEALGGLSSKKVKVIPNK